MKQVKTTNRMSFKNTKRESNIENAKSRVAYFGDFAAKQRGQIDVDRRRVGRHQNLCARTGCVCVQETRMCRSYDECVENTAGVFAFRW